jgi:hypothetical protein
MISLKTELSEKLENVNQYLADGTALSKVEYYDDNGKLIYVDSISSKWTTALGKQRVETAHRAFIGYYTSNVHSNTHFIRVTSPFVETKVVKDKVRFTASRDVNVNYAKV